ncbi:trihelix transcription factor GT-3a [Oryzias melastigma]|uniref:trihelix transcription factor GT-3a n=1 Tax=Oryzias melastigma TaxID=30732 RepID=UPI000CF7F346|nr:trihelix transcription factor GT-3a [Oryzias melastigma]
MTCDLSSVKPKQAMRPFDKKIGKMTTKGALWSRVEVEFLLEIWADDTIQDELDKTHKNSKIYSKIRDVLNSRGFNRTTEQCRDKIKKMRCQYLKIRDALRRSGSSLDEKDKIFWFDAVDKILGQKPCSEAVMFEPQESRTHPVLAAVTASTLSATSSVSDASLPVDQPSQDTFDDCMDVKPPTLSRKKKRKTRLDASDVMGVFIERQQQQHEEFMRMEELRHEQEIQMLKDWMKASMEAEERRLEMQRQTNHMFERMMNRLLDSMVPPPSQRMSRAQQTSPM